MVIVSFTGLVSLFALLVNLGGVAAAPAHSNGTMLDNPNFVPLPSQLTTRAAPASPHWVAYQDRTDPTQTTVGPPAPSAIQGFNVFLMAFLTLSGPMEQASIWQDLTDSERASIKSAYSSAGIKLLVSAFGALDTPTTSGADPIATANTMAEYVIQYGLDGIDVDYEDYPAMSKQDGKAEAWLVTFTTQLRAKLPQDSYIITHAPFAAWFSLASYKSGAYLTVNSQVGSMIDWYNVQYYNEGDTEYATCEGLLTSSTAFPGAAVFQIAASGIPLSKIVIGKPAIPSDGPLGGYMDTSTLASCVQQAQASGWNAGVSVWQYPDATASWISAVRALSWPA